MKRPRDSRSSPVIHRYEAGGWSRPSLAGVVLALALALAAPASAESSKTEPGKPVNSPSELVLFSVLGFLGKWLFDQWGFQNAKNREFAAKTTEKVVELAWEHYWKLANITGTLGGQLTTYIRSIDYSLLLIYNSPDDFRNQRDDITHQLADESFISFVRLVHAFEGFQFRGSNTYLLPHHAAGLTLRRLYNQFIESLSGDLNHSMSDLRLVVERKTSQKGRDDVQSPPDLSSAQFEQEWWFTFLQQDRNQSQYVHKSVVAGSDLGAVELQEKVTKARNHYKDWLANQPWDVSKAADSLIAFARLLSHELAELHAIWHMENYPFAKREAWKQAEASRQRWPGLLDKESVTVIRRARTTSIFFAPLGVGQLQQLESKRRSSTGSDTQPRDKGINPSEDRFIDKDSEDG